ncbi:MAG: hypothetical protein RL021_2041 [Bacteroidota bacterium]
MIRLFRSPQPAVLFLIPLIAIVLWANRWSDLPVVQGNALTPLWNLFAPLFQAIPAWLRFVLMVFTVSGTAIYFSSVINKYEVLYKNSYLPALFYVLLASSLPGFISVHPLHFATLLLIRVLDLSFTLGRTDKVAGRIFSAGFIISLALLLWFAWAPVALYFLVLLAFLRPPNVREWLIALTGLGLPFFFLFVWWFPETLPQHWKELQQFFSDYRLQKAQTLPDPSFRFTVYAGLILLLSLIKLRGNYYKNIVRTRVYQQTVLVLLMLSLAMAFTSGAETENGMFILLLPASTLFAYYFVSVRRRFWLYESMFWVLTGLIVWNHIAI